MIMTVYNDKAGRALQGHDPVAFFTAGAPTKGDPSISYDWRGATWLFSTDANRDLFVSDPTEYAPQFGGHCAVGRAIGKNYKGSAKRWRIEDDKLYVNKNLLANMLYPLFSRRIHELAEQPEQ